eukprot:jgi/Mesen1/8692/ME000519S08085
MGTLPHGGDLPADIAEAWPDAGGPACLEYSSSASLSAAETSKSGHRLQQSGEIESLRENDEDGLTGRCRSINSAAHRGSRGDLTNIQRGPVEPAKAENLFEVDNTSTSTDCILSKSNNRTSSMKATSKLTRAPEGQLCFSSNETLEEQLLQRVDSTSYLLGQRTALERTLKRSMADREQVSGLDASIQDLKRWMQQDSARLRQLETAGSGLHSAVAATSERQHSLEQKVPELERGLAEVRGRLGEHVGVAAQVAALQLRVAAIEATQQHMASFEAILALKQMRQEETSLSGMVARCVKRAGGAAAAHLAQVDKVALYLARRILLDSMDGSSQSIRASEMEQALTEDTSGHLAGENARQTLALVGTLAEEASRRRHRAIVGAALLVTGVESGYRLQKLSKKGMPQFLKTLSSPVEQGLRVVRMLVWAAAFIVGTQELKRACFLFADALLRIRGTRTTAPPPPPLPLVCSPSPVRRGCAGAGKGGQQEPTRAGEDLTAAVGAGVSDHGVADHATGSAGWVVEKTWVVL